MKIRFVNLWRTDYSFSVIRHLIMCSKFHVFIHGNPWIIMLKPNFGKNLPVSLFILFYVPICVHKCKRCDPSTAFSSFTHHLKCTSFLLMLAFYYHQFVPISTFIQSFQGWYLPSSIQWAMLSLFLFFRLEAIQIGNWSRREFLYSRWEKNCLEC